MPLFRRNPMAMHAAPRASLARRIAGYALFAVSVAILAAGAMLITSQPSQARGIAHPPLARMSWVQLVRYCHMHGRSMCDVLPAGVRAEYQLGQRPARMVTFNGDTVYIVADHRGHVAVIDES